VTKGRPDNVSCVLPLRSSPGLHCVRVAMWSFQAGHESICLQRRSYRRRRVVPTSADTIRWTDAFQGSNCPGLGGTRGARRFSRRLPPEGDPEPAKSSQGLGRGRIRTTLAFPNEGKALERKAGRPPAECPSRDRLNVQACLSTSITRCEQGSRKCSDWAIEQSYTAWRHPSGSRAPGNPHVRR